VGTLAGWEMHDKFYPESGKGPLGRPSEVHMKIDRKETGYDDIDSIHLF
jgi:hypothetical protein